MVTAVILAGGLGTRFGKETADMPKPMIRIGDEPVIWHIMKLYAHHCVKRFVICGGYKIGVLREYVLNYHATHSDFTVDTGTGEVAFLNGPAEDWGISVVDTGALTGTGGRLKAIAENGGAKVCHGSGGMILPRAA